MFLLGTAVNAVAIAIGSLLGLVLPRIPERVKTTILQGLAMAVILIGLGMALSDQKDILYIIVSLVIGALIGEWIAIEDGLMRFGRWIESKVQRSGGGQVAEAFVATSLIYCVGSMAIVGAIQSGVYGNHSTLFAKAMLDGFSSIVFSSTLGFGVMLASVPVFVYQGIIATVSHLAGAGLNSPAVIACTTGTGGLLIVCIGINILEIKKIAVGNLLPAMFVAGLLRWAVPHMVQWGAWFMHG